MDHRPTPTRTRRPSSPLAMSAAERERFLADVHVGVVAHGRPDGGAPLSSPVWYAYEPGRDVTFVTSAGSLKAEHLAREGNATFLVQQEAPPQRFVSVSGPVRVTQGSSSEVRRSIASRYLPEDAVDGFLATTPDDALVTVSLSPDVWRSSDFGKLAATPPT